MPEKLDTIEYAYRAFGHREKLLLLSNGLFKYYKNWWGCLGGGEFYSFYGGYTQKGNHLQLHPDSLIYATYPDDFRRDTLIRKHYLYQPVPVFGKHEKIAIKTSYDIVQWGDMEILLSEDKVLPIEYPEMLLYNPEFTFPLNDNDYTLLAEKYQPKTTARDISRRFLTRTGKEFTDQDSLLPLPLREIPPRWQYLFQQNRMKAKITKAYSIYTGDYGWGIVLHFGGDNNVYKIDKGSVNGIKFGMIFHDIKFHPYKVIWLNKHESTVMAIDRHYESNLSRLRKGEILFN